jgi:hypothetical protein
MLMPLESWITHDHYVDCIACRCSELAANIVGQAVAAWEVSKDLPRGSLALFGAAGLLAALLVDGYSRQEIEKALSELLDEIETDVAAAVSALGGLSGGNA